MKKYIVVDKQGCSFMEWSYEDPQTAQQIRSYLYSIHKDECTEEPIKWNNFTLDICAEIWDLDFISVEFLDRCGVWDKYSNEFSDESLHNETTDELLDTVSFKTGKLIEYDSDRGGWWIETTRPQEFK